MIPPSHPPPGRRPVPFLVVFTLAYAGGVVAYLPLLSLLLPLKIGAATGEARLDVLTAAVVVGAVAASLSNILFGALSDRSLARGGGRRRGLAGGLAATAVAYGVIAWAQSPAAIVLAVALFQVAVNALLAPLLAIMADEVPDAQRGLAGGLLSLGAPAASAVAALLVGVGSLGEAARLAIVPLASAACILPLLLSRSVAAVDPPATAGAPIPRGDRRDLLLAWSSRLLVQVAGNVLLLYLLYYFESIVPGVARGELAAGVGRLLTAAYLIALPIALAAGRLSDRIGTRRPFLLAAAAVAALGLLGLAAATGWTAGAVAFALYTIGSSVFLALHAGFAMQLLPDPRHRGRDLGLLNLTNTLPALAGPLLAWSLATPREFAPVMLVLSGLTLVGGCTMLAVRGWRQM